MKKKISILSLLLVFTMTAMAQTPVNGIYYNLNGSDNTAEVTQKTDGTEYSGDIVIPASISVGGVDYSVTSIGYYAFERCSLTSIKIPNTVTSIGNNAFDGCSSLTSIEIPNSVTSIGNRAFASCSNLTSIVVEEGNSYYDSRENCNAIIETSSNTLVAGFQNTVIPTSVTAIGEGAFFCCSCLTSIEIPNSVTEIGEYAFSYCSYLTSIEIPNSVTEIRDGAFYYCSGLTSIEIPNSVTSIGDNAFDGCSNLTSIEIPNSVTSIGNRAFASCSNLTSIVVEEGNSYYDSRENCNAIIETSSNTLVAGFQNTVIPTSVTAIGEGAFFCCSCLTSIEIPNSVTEIGEYAFSYCSYLTSIEIPNSVTEIGEYAFSYCSKLTSIEIPNSVTSIGDYAFWGCSGLTSITMQRTTPPTVGSNLFFECSKLETIYVPVGASDAYNVAPWNTYNIIESALDVSEVTFDFQGNPWELPLGSGTGETADAGNVEEITQDGVVLSLEQLSASTHPRMWTWTGAQLRVYKKNQLTVKAPAGKVVTKAVWTAAGASYYGLTVNDEAVDATAGWSGAQAEVPFVATVNGRYTKLVVTLADEGTEPAPDPTPDPNIPVPLWTSPFDANQGNFTIIDKVLPAELTNVWNWAGANYGMKASSYFGRAYASESWLVSPVLDLAAATDCSLTFSHCANHFKAQENFVGACKLMVKESTAADWTELAYEGLPSGTSWDFVEATASLKAYDGKKVQFAFVYSSTAELAGTWEVKGIAITGKGSVVESTPDIPEDTPNYEPRHNGTKTNNYRPVTAVKLIGESSGNHVYTLTSAEQNKDYTDVTASVVFQVEPGEKLTPKVEHNATWMNHAVYIDKDKNGFTGAIAAGSEWKPAGDLVSYSFYNNGADDDTSGWNSVGEVISGDNRKNPPLPAFTAPTEPGIYRMRFVQDWCSIDPAGDADGKFGDFKENGGQIVDVMLEVLGPIFLTDGEDYTNTKLKMRDRITYTRNFNNTQWQAWYVPFDIDYDAISDDFTAASLNAVHQYDDDEDGVFERWTLEILKLKSGEVLRANMPYMIRAKGTGEHNFVVENAILYPAEENSLDCSSVRVNYTFKGNYSLMDGQELRDNGWFAPGGGSLVTPTVGSNLKAYRWLLMPEARSGYGTFYAPKRINIVIGDEEGEVTGIEEVAQEEWPTDVYDLNGRMVKAQAENLDELPKGVYIVNGKKFVK